MRGLGVLMALLFHGAMSQMMLHSDAFHDHETMPDAFVCDPIERDGFRPSVPLNWLRPPAKVQSFVLMMDDMNSTGVVHWLVQDIPRLIDTIEFDATETNMPEGSMELTNSFGWDSYIAPCTGYGIHYFRFRLFAMSKVHSKIDLSGLATVTVDDVMSQIQDNIIYTANLVGLVDGGAAPATPFPTPPPTPLPVHRNHTAGNTTLVSVVRSGAMRNLLLGSNQTWPSTSRRTSRNVTTPIQHVRYPKPSEVLRPGMASLNENPCEGAKAVKLAECLMNLEQTKTQVNNDVWGCTGLKGHHAGVRYLSDGQIERCPMQVRIGGVSCDKPRFPLEATCFGKTPTHPQIMWQGSPEHTLSYVVLVDDLSPSIVHPTEIGNIFWLVSSIPGTADGISPANATLPPMSVEMKNTFDSVGYTPPCPQGARLHNYRVKVFAMPHVSSTSFISERYSAERISKELQKYALCVASHELSFAMG